ncbi:hypothetical protein FQN60_013528 [Etheostoma spectabile]|uniref:Uncharacterized protein n=1 Tax=Etheostoma spectabile TaxID=54343 RepID=A0A5J5CJX0_9PERO|nr:hypothetical protein FQN60_013528 [Etheostoma spectabile]
MMETLVYRQNDCTDGKSDVMPMENLKKSVRVVMRYSNQCLGSGCSRSELLQLLKGILRNILDLSKFSIVSSGTKHYGAQTVLQPIGHHFSNGGVCVHEVARLCVNALDGGQAVIFRAPAGRHVLLHPAKERLRNLKDADRPGVALPVARHLKLLNLTHAFLWEKHQHPRPVYVSATEAAEAIEHCTTCVPRGSYKNEVVAHLWEAVGEELGHQLQGEHLLRNFLHRVSFATQHPHVKPFLIKLFPVTQNVPDGCLCLLAYYPIHLHPGESLYDVFTVHIQVDDQSGFFDVLHCCSMKRVRACQGNNTPRDREVTQSLAFFLQETLSANCCQLGSHRHLPRRLQDIVININYR